LKSSLRGKLDTLSLRLEELSALLSSPDVTRDLDRYRALTKEHSDIDPVVALYRKYRQAEADLVAADEMTADPEMRAYADDEVVAVKSRMETLEAELQRMLLPSDPNDERNVFLEIRAGTGGDESALFAGSPFRMYTRFAERNRWQVEDRVGIVR
jgi:peptide chain release factor 1